MNDNVMSDKLLAFPCLFPIKIMGTNAPDLIAEVSAIISRNAAHFEPQADIATKLSKQGNYLSITATIMATSQRQLDTIYTELNQHKLVKITL
jgi:putative lipoic acid-binding regulatory protein